MTYSVSRAARPSADAVFVARSQSETMYNVAAAVTRAPLVNTFTTNGIVPFARQQYRYQFPIDSVSGDRMVISEMGGTDQFDTVVDGAFDGHPVRIYRIVNGALQMVREDVVDRWHARVWVPVWYNKDRTLPSSARSYLFAVGDEYRRGAPLQLTVVAINSSGGRSPFSTVYSWTSPNPWVSQSDLGNADTVAIGNKIYVGDTIDPALSAPANVVFAIERDGHAVRVTWDEVPGAHGYVVCRTQYDFADLLTDTVDLVGGVGKEPLQAGDLAIFQRKINASDARASFASDRNFYKGFKTTTPFGYVEELPVVPIFETLQDPVEGEVMRATVASGRSVEADAFTHSGTAQTNYDVLNPDWTYKVTARARGAVGGETLTLRQETHFGVWRTESFTLTTEWADYTATFAPTNSLDTGATARRFKLVLSGACTVDLAWMVCYRGEPGDEMLRVRAEERAMMQELGLTHLRLQNFVRSRPLTNDLADLTNFASRGGFQGLSLPVMLRMLEDEGLEPWFTIEWHWSDEDFLGLAEYLCAPYDPQTDTPETKPWAYRRHLHRPAGPWVDVFSLIPFELGNENWNPLTDFYYMPGISGQSIGVANALWLDRVAGLMKSSPYWTPAIDEKFKWVIGGWNAQPAYNLDNISTSVQADYMTIADYNGGWDAGDKVVMRADNPGHWPRVVGIIAGGRRGGILKAQVDAANAGRSKPLLLGSYEAGPGYQLDGLNGATVTAEDKAQQELIMKSVGSGTATLDAYLYNAALGFDAQTFYSFVPRDQWGTHTRWHQGGRLNPPAMWYGWFNRNAVGAHVSQIEPLLPVKEVWEGRPNSDMLGAYRIDAPDNVAVVLCNRRADAATSVVFTVDAPASGTLTRVAMTGGYQAHNTTFATKDAVALVETPVAYSTRIETTVPAGEAVAYVWSAA